MSDDARRMGNDAAVERPDRRPLTAVGGLPLALADTGLAAGLIALGLLAHWPVFSFSFFWEDPFDIGQVEPFSYLQLLVVPNSNSYYRPLLLVLLKLLKLGGAFYRPAPYHVFVVVGHLLATVVLYGFARFLFADPRRADHRPRGRWPAAAAGLIFLLYPPAFEATSRASSFHSWFTALSLVALWLYAWGRQTGRRWTLFAALAAVVLAQGIHENGVLFPGFALVLEIWLVWRKRVDRFHPGVLIFLAPALVFFLIWLSIPKPVEPPQFGLHPREALYLSQGLSFPFAGLISSIGGLGLSPEAQAGLALAGTAALLVAVHGRSGWPYLALFLLWWLGANSLAWLLRPIEYLEVSPRVIYFPSFAVALAWAGVVSLRPVRSALGSLLILAIVVQSWLTLGRTVQLYANGSKLMKQIVAAGAQAGEGGKLLFVNVPDRFEYRQPMYPLGYWGMLLAPVSQDLSDFVQFAAGVEMQTQSLSDFPLRAAMIEASPYRVHTRGEDSHGSDRLYETIEWADETYWTEYHADGSLTLRYVGDVRAKRTTRGALGRIGNVAELAAADSITDNRLQITLDWFSLSAARPTDTIFVHLYAADGELVGQGDGDSLGGLLPPSAWRPGHEIVDRRIVVVARTLAPGEYRLTVGMYNRADGSRYPAFDVHGVELPNSELEASRILIP